MVVPPDSNNPPDTLAATPQPDRDLTLNGAPSGEDLDAVHDLPLAPVLDSSEEQPPGVDIFVPAEADRSWLSRFRTLRASWKKEHLARTSGDEPVTTEAAGNLEAHLASLAALRDVCTGIDQRLARVEQVSGREDIAAIDEALRDLCSQTYERLVRIEAAVQRTEEAAAQKTLHALCQSIDGRLERAEDTLHSSERVVAEWLEGHTGHMTARFAGIEGALQRTEEAVTDKALRELCQNIDARLERTEDALHRGEGAAAEGLQQLVGSMTARFEAVEEAVRLTPKSVTERMLPNIERQLMQARMALERTEEAVSDKTLHELCQNINARLERTEDRLHRSEDIVASSVQELSARMTARFAEAEEIIQRIERSVSNRTVEYVLPPQAGHLEDRPVQAEEVARPLYTRQKTRPVQLPWMAGLVVPVLVLVATLAIAALIKTSRGEAPEKVASLSTIDQISTPTVRTPAPEILAPSPTVVMANAPRSTRVTRVSVPQQRSPSRESDPATVRQARFVGTLSITSVPSGASVSINGKPAGKTPLRLARQRAGSLAVQVAHDGFERWSAAVLVPADQLTQVTANLRASAR